MDPYELFSTPPSGMVLSSTPIKTKGTKTTSHSARKANPSPARRAHISPTRRASPGIAKKALNSSSVKKVATAYHSPAVTTRSNRQRAKKQQTANNNNLWDKCLKTNPELAQFVDNFNQSLEEALSKPLDTE